MQLPPDVRKPKNAFKKALCPETEHIYKEHILETCVMTEAFFQLKMDPINSHFCPFILEKKELLEPSGKV